MDINTLRSFSVVLVAVAFAGVCWWAFAPSRKKRFEEASRLPFADEQQVSDDKKHAEERLQSADQKQGQS